MTTPPKEFIRLIQAYLEMGPQERVGVVNDFFLPEHHPKVPHAGQKQALLMLYMVLLRPGGYPGEYGPLLYEAQMGGDFSSLREGRTSVPTEKHLYKGNFLAPLSSASTALRAATPPVVEQVDAREQTNIRLQPIAAYLKPACVTAEAGLEEKESPASFDYRTLVEPLLQSLLDCEEAEFRAPLPISCREDLEKFRQSVQQVEKEMRPLTEKLLPLLVLKRSYLVKIERLNKLIHGLDVAEMMPEDVTPEEVRGFLAWRHEQARSSLKIVSQE